MLSLSSLTILYIDVPEKLHAFEADSWQSSERDKSIYKPHDSIFNFLREATSIFQASCLAGNMGFLLKGFAMNHAGPFNK